MLLKNRKLLERNEWKYNPAVLVLFGEKFSTGVELAELVIDRDESVDVGL